MFPVIKREFVVDVSCFELLFCDADVRVRPESGCCCEGGFVYKVA